MAGNMRVLFTCVLLAIISGCTNKPVFTVEVYQTPTPTQWMIDPFDSTPTPSPTFSPTPTVEFLPTFSPPTLAPILESVPTLTPSAGVMPSGFSPILYGKKFDADTFFILLGGVQGNTWLSPEQAAAQFSGAYPYDVYAFSKGGFQVYGYAPELSHPNNSYSLETDASFNEFGMVGVAQGWPVRQVIALELSLDNETYQNVVSDWLMGERIARPERGTLRIFRVDLEGDGVDEVFISATHLDESQHTSKSGDYSIVLMRKVVANEVVTLPIVADVYRSQELEITYPRTYSLANFIDLNQDGVLEVIVDYQGWEDVGAMIYQVNGQEITQVP